MKKAGLAKSPAVLDAFSMHVYLASHLVPTPPCTNIVNLDEHGVRFSHVSMIVSFQILVWNTHDLGVRLHNVMHTFLVARMCARILLFH